MSFYLRYPSASASANPSVGTNGTAIPTSSTLIAGENPSFNLQPLQTDASGNLLVSLAADPISPLSVNLADVGGAAISLGQKTASASIPVILASDQTLPLPTGAATSALQTTGNTSLASIDTKTPALGQALAAASVPVVLTAAQISTLTPLSTVTANQGTANATPWNENISEFGGASVSLGSKTSAASIPVVIASDQGTLPLPTGAATSALQTTGNTSLASIATNTGKGPAGRAFANAPTVTTYGTPITSAAYVTIIASTTSATDVVEIFDSSGVALFFAVGAAASEVNQFVIYPGGNGQVPLAIPAGSRISYKAVSTSASGATAFNVLNLYT